jgi:hypothetical protein
MHQSVVSAFPTKRLITKRVRVVVPQETGFVEKENGNRVGGKRGLESEEASRGDEEKRPGLEKRYSKQRVNAAEVIRFEWSRGQKKLRAR